MTPVPKPAKRVHGGRLREPKRCAVCSAEYRPWSSLQRTCSTRCAGRLKPPPPIRPPATLTRECPVCRQPFASDAPSNRRRVYCSLACKRTAHRAAAWTDATCLNCGGTFRKRTQPTHQLRRTFCSRGCSQNYTAGATHPGWRGGGAHYRGRGWRAIAERIRARDGYRCRRCGKSQEENGRRLPVDHVIPWRTFADEAEANAEANLVALCDACHARKLAAENAWLRGDVLAMEAYRRAVARPWQGRTVESS